MNKSIKFLLPSIFILSFNFNSNAQEIVEEYASKKNDTIRIGKGEKDIITSLANEVLPWKSNKNVLKIY